MKHVKWIEPFATLSDGSVVAVVCKMSYDDVVKYQRDREPRYETNEQAFEDFCVVHWGTVEDDSENQSKS